MADLKELANEYLVTPDGRTPEEPCGLWCGDGDVSIWFAIVQRVGKAVRTLVQANTTVTYPKDLMPDVAKWLWGVRRFGGGNITHVFGAGTDEVLGLIAYARYGVQLLFKLQTVVEKQGGTVPGPGPVPDPQEDDSDWFPGPDEAWWVAGGMVLTLVLLQLWRSR